MGDGGSGTFTLVMIGIILLMVGGVVRAIIWHVDDSDAMQIMMSIIDIFAFLGVAIISLGLFHGGITKTGQSDMVRLGMLVSAGIVIGLMASSLSPLSALFNLF